MLNAVGQDALRNEKAQRDMLKQHIRSITYVVKGLTNELDVTEDRCMNAIANMKQNVCFFLLNSTDNTLMPLKPQLLAAIREQTEAREKHGITLQQQQLINDTIKESVGRIMADQKSFAPQVTIQLKALSDRIDDVMHRVRHVFS